MPIDERTWDALKKGQDRIVLLGSVVALIVGVLDSLLDAAHPPVLTLALFSALVVGYCGWMFVARHEIGEDGAVVTGPRFSNRRRALATLATAVVLAGAWGFVYRENIRYSRAVDRIVGGPRILVSDHVAWQWLTYKTAAGVVDRTVIGEIGTLLSGLPYRAVVVPEQTVLSPAREPRDRVAISGIGEESGLAVKVAVVVSNTASGDVAADLQRRVTYPGGNDVGLPAQRLFDVDTLARMFVATVPLPVSLAPEQHASVTRLLIRYTLGMALYADGNPEASRLFRDMIDLGELLPHIDSPPLARLYAGVAFYFVQRDGHPELAVRAIQLAAAMDPASQPILATRIWLLLKTGQTAVAGRLLGPTNAFTDDPGLGDWLAAEYASAMKDRAAAIVAYEKALRLERSETMQAQLHFDAAFAYAMSERLDQRTIGGGIIRHLEDARQIEDNAVYSVIQAYGWAVLGNADRFDASFRHADALLGPSLAEGKQDDARRFFAHWRAKSLLTLKQPQAAKAAIEQFIGDPSQSDDAALLQDFGAVLLDVAGYTGKPEAFEAGERYFDRIIELAPQDAMAHFSKGVALVMQAQNTAVTEGEAQRRLRDAARSQFLLAIRLGDDRPVTHSVLANLYEGDGDRVNAQKHRDRYCELGPKDPECLMALGARLAKNGDAAAARLAFANARDSGAFAQDQALLQEAEAWSLAGKPAEAERAYREVLKVAPDSFQAHDNLGFVLFDLGRAADALAQFEAALRLDPKDADALGGKAIALETLGNRKAAATAFRAAVAADRDFLDTTILQDRFAWSDRAVRTVAPLIEALRGVAP